MAPTLQSPLNAFIWWKLACFDWILFPLKNQCHFSMKGLRFGLVGPILRIMWGSRCPRYQFSGWNPRQHYWGWLTRTHGINQGPDSRFVPSQWEMALLYNNVSHWLGAILESALSVIYNINLIHRDIVGDQRHLSAGTNSMALGRYSIQFKFIAILLHMKYRINKRQVKITTKWYHVSPSCNEVWINTKYKNKIRLGVEQQGNPLFWFWWDTERI